jgi:NifU-like protein involved in Fe-S cluster formation
MSAVLDVNEDATCGTGMVGAPACGDVMRLQIKVNEVRHHRGCASFKTYGCGSCHRLKFAGDRMGQGQEH